LLQARQHFASEFDKGVNQVLLALMQRLAGDTASAKVTAEQGRDTLERLCEDQPDNVRSAAWLSLSYAVLGNEDSALKEAERAIMLLPSTKDRMDGPGYEETLALNQMTFGENSRAISTLTRLLQTPYDSWLYGPYGPAPLTPALLRLDPIWDPLRTDPAFQKLCKEKVEKSIAVLPFENLSRDLDNAYFTEGVQEEILTRLANISDLKVISRTSTQRYQSKPDDLAEVAKQLGVANILEGSVQKAADQVRVNVQLVNAQTDSHLWADTFDRKLTDIFSVESEVAKRIAESLQAKLTGREEQALAVKPTNNAEAYDAYLRGLALEGRSFYSPETLREFKGSYERAVQLDPNFALAWARLSRADAFLYFTSIHFWSKASIDQTSAWRDAAKSALENAQRLQPNSSEALLALGYYQYWVLRDYGAAKTTFDRVGKMLPSNSDVPRALALIARREGHWDESIAYFEQALSLDPRNMNLLTFAAGNYIMVRQFAAARKLYDRALDIVPNDLDLMAEKAAIYRAEGNLQEAAKLLANVNTQTPSRAAFASKITQLTLERNLGEAARWLRANLAQFHFDTEYDKASYQAWLAFTQRLAGDTAGAKVTAEQARNTLEPLYGDQPDDPGVVESLSCAYAAMGEKDSALKAAERAIMLVPRAKDRMDGPVYEENLASIQTMFGENSQAISTLTRLLQTPYPGDYHSTPITPALLRLDPIWDPLRSDPAFQKLCEEKQQ
jgi:TolB-like protein/Tfp pilus assembly protein PilF